MNSLKTLWVVMRKELLDFFRDRRTVALSLLLSPVLVPVLLIGLFTLTENRIRDLTDKPLELPVIGKQHAPNLIAWLEGQNVTIVDPPADVAAACAVALLSLALTLLMFKLTAVISPTVGRQMAVSFSTIALLLLILMPMVFIGTTLLTYLSATAKSMKEAQSHMSWLMLLPMLPSIVLMVNPVKTQLWQFAVPFLAQNQLILKVVRGEVVSPAQWGIYLGASFALAGLMWFLAVRRYRGEQLAISG